ncbi:ABC-three component system middle component 5 [Stenotrophomonas maltophilia]|uniref:ABC-three component system middle component 5 n=1 Tax=Stenotrophomonas maltophilia TaxID=40324 RepID=UPI003D7E1C08
MASARIWHPSRDAYHCAFRLIRLLLSGSTPLEIERYRILDVFVLYPALLSRMRMSRSDRELFRELPVANLQNIFIRLPSIASVYQSLTIYQNSALTQLVARGIVDPDELKKGVIRISQSDIPDSLSVAAFERNTMDGGVMDFISSCMSRYSLMGSDGMFRRCGIPERVVV